jgi:hypothetical protein
VCCDHDPINFNAFDLIPTHALSGVRMKKLCICISLFDSTVFAALLPVGCSCFDGHGEAVSAERPVLQPCSNI